MTDPICTEGMRHAAEEDGNTGNHLQANYLRAGADEIDRLRAELESLINAPDNRAPQASIGAAATAGECLLIENTDPPQLCSFCGWGSGKPLPGRTLIHHVGVNICSDCVAKCNVIMNARGMFMPGDLEYLSWKSPTMGDYDRKHEGNKIDKIYCFNAELTARDERIAGLEAALRTWNKAFSQIPCWARKWDAFREARSAAKAAFDE